jgi:hypothetical protein
MPVSCGSFRVICAGFMLDKITACGPLNLSRLLGFGSNLDPKPLFPVLIHLLFPYQSIRPVEAFELRIRFANMGNYSRSALGIICQS